MKLKYICILSLLILFYEKTEAIGLDKYAHAVGSYGLTHSAQALCNRWTDGEHKTGCLVTGVVTAAAIGATKEILDQRAGRNNARQSLEDGAADAVGIGLAVLFIQIDF